MSSSALLHSPRRSGSETMSLDNVLNPPTSESYNVPWEGHQHPWTQTDNGPGYNDYHTASHPFDAMSYHAHAHAPQPLPPPRLDHQHYSPYRYPQPHPQPAMYSPPIDDYSEYPHDNYDMLSQRSQGHGYPDPPVPQHSVEPSLADINHLQNAERASTRIFVRQSLGVAPVPRYLDRYDDDVDFPYASSSGSHKRPASNAEALQPPKPKKQKKRGTDSGPQPSTSKRGFNAKKRGEVAQVNRENERVVNGKGKGRAIDDNLPPAQLGAPLTPERQAARCMSAKYRSDKIPRCLSCTRRWAGDTCRFQGVRIFYRAPDGSVDFVSFTQNPMDTVKPVTFPTKWNIPFSEEHRKITQIMAARTLLPVLEAEQRHVQHSDETVFRSRETDCRASCDTCMTSTFSETWMCRSCGREACKDCFARVASLTMMKPGITHDEAARSRAQREKLNELNPSFLSCLKRTDHDANSFSRVTRFSPDELTRAIEDMRKVLEEEESEANSSLEGTPELSHMAPSSSTDSSGIRTPVDSVGSSGIPTASTSPFTPSPMESIKDNFPYPDVPSHQIHRFETVDDISRAQFNELWRAGEPIVIGGMLDRLKIDWTPEYFIQHHGDTSVRLLECQANFDSGRMTVAEFFKLFGQYEGRKPDVLKLRDWPPTSDFKTMFPDLFEDFSNAVPFPDYVRRDGVLNMSSHFPVDVLAPDVGPKMYNAMATTTGTGSQGSTRLHMDMADALNIMTYASPCPDGSEGCAAWDLFRREDAETVRAFLKETFGFGKTETSRRHGPDPIHSQLFYLTDELLQQLYEKHGVKSFRFYQKPGEAVMIPAGCAHQVANLADSIKVAIDYVSPENITACETLTREFRSQNVRSAWKDDVLQLRSMMWYAWQSCQRTDMEKDTA